MFKKNLKLDIGFYILFTFSIISYFIFVLAPAPAPGTQCTRTLPLYLLLNPYIEPNMEANIEPNIEYNIEFNIEFNIETQY